MMGLGAHLVLHRPAARLSPALHTSITGPQGHSVSGKRTPRPGGQALHSLWPCIRPPGACGPSRGMPRGCWLLHTRTQCVRASHSLCLAHGKRGGGGQPQGHCPSHLGATFADE